MVFHPQLRRVATGLLVVLAALVVSASPAAAQQIAFEEFLNEVFRSSPPAQQALHEQEIAAQGVRSARARLLPQVDSSASVTHHDRRIEIPLPDVPGVDVDTPVFQYQNVARLGINAGVALLDPAAWAGLQAAQLGFDGAREQRAADLLAVERNAVEIFAQWLENDVRVLSAQQRVDLAVAHRDQLTAMLEQGTATTLDLRRTELALVEAQLALTQALDARDSIAHQAAQLILADEAITFSGTLPPPPDEPTSVTAAAALRASQAQTGQRAAALGFAPRVVATASANWVSAPYIDDRDYAWQVQAALQWTLFAGGARHAAQRVAAERQAHAALAYNATVSAQNHQRQMAIDHVATATTQQQAAEQRRQLAAEVATITRESFAQGVATSTDVLSADFALADAEAAADLAQMAVTLARWRVRWAGLDAAVQ